MPGGFPLLGNVCNAFEIAGLTASNTYPIVLTKPGTLNTPGAWLQLTASSTYDVTWLAIDFSDSGNSSTAGNFAVDIGIGSSGNEIVIIPSLALFIVSTNTYSANRWMIPVQIPAGTRISARYQTSSPVATSQVCIHMTGYSGGMTQSQLGAVDVLGFSSGSSAGTTLTSSGSANVKGSYAQLVASTAADYIGLMAAFTSGTVGGNDMAIDVATGSSGNEIVIIPNIPMKLPTVASGLFGEHGTTPFLPIPIPAGTRLSARVQSGTGSQTIGFLLYGVR